MSTLRNNQVQKAAAELALLGLKSTADAGLVRRSTSARESLRNLDNQLRSRTNAAQAALNQLSAACQVVREVAEEEAEPYLEAASDNEVVLTVGSRTITLTIE